MQLSKTWILVADKGLASEADRIKGKWYDFISCTVTSSEFAALHLEYKQLKALKYFIFQWSTEHLNFFMCS